MRIRSSRYCRCILNIKNNRTRQRVRSATVKFVGYSILRNKLKRVARPTRERHGYLCAQIFFNLSRFFWKTLLTASARLIFSVSNIISRFSKKLSFTRPLWHYLKIAADNGSILQENCREVYANTTLSFFFINIKV